VQEETLVEKGLNIIRNNPVAAVVIVVSVILIGASTVYKALPDSMQNYIPSLLFPKPPASNGWAFVGMLDKADDNRWVSGPKIEMVRQSGASDREYPFRIGDQVRVIRAMPQVIIDYRDKQKQNVLVKPTSVRGAINPDADYTGSVYTFGAEYGVMDIDVNG